MGSSTGGRRDDIDPEHLTALQEGRVSRRAPLPKHSPSTMAFCWPMSCRRPERNFVQPSRMRSRWESSSVCNGSGRRFGILTRSWNSWLTWPHIDRTPFVDGPVSLWPVIRGSDRRHCWNASNPSQTIPILMAARPTLATDLSASIALLVPWTASTSERIRRFASEVLRPRGVWATHIKELKSDPQQGCPILHPLRADPSRYVQDSVANWINDAAKTRPEWARDLCSSWLADDPAPETERIVKRALRSLTTTG